MCEAKNLSKKGMSIVSQCPESKLISIWHNNLILNFTPRQFNNFRTVAQKFDFDERSRPFPDNQVRAVLKTPVDHVNFTFTVDEWEDFLDAMDEAFYMQQVLELID
jgi:hypothetical protein